MRSAIAKQVNVNVNKVLASLESTGAAARKNKTVTAYTLGCSSFTICNQGTLLLVARAPLLTGRPCSRQEAGQDCRSGSSELSA